MDRREVNVGKKIRTRAIKSEKEINKKFVTFQKLRVYDAP